MFKFINICFFAVLTLAAANPSLIAPLAYSSPLAHHASPLALTAPAVVGSNSYVAPYATSYNAHGVAHSAAFPTAHVVEAPLAAHHLSAPLLLKK